MTQLYYVKGVKGHFSFKLMIDSGASISIMSSSMVQLLGLKMTKGYHMVHGVGGQAKILGTINQCKLHIHSTSLIPIAVNFSVLHNPLDKHTIILGLDFLERYKCIINAHQKTVQLGPHIVKVMDKKELLKYKLPINHKLKK